MQRLTRSQEFSIEIPDKEADAIHSGMLNSKRDNGNDQLIRLIVDKAVEYILAQPDGEIFSSFSIGTV